MSAFMLKHNVLSPLRRNIFEPLKMLKNGSPRLRYGKHLEKSQYLPEQKLREIQWQRLTGLLHHVWENNNFYRARFEKAGVVPGQIKTLDDMQKIPLLTKEEIRRHTTEMISNGYSQDTLLRFKTGGSTGKSLEIYLTEDCSEMRNACARRHDRWAGWQAGEPIGAVWGNPVLPVSWKSRIDDWFVNPFIYLDTMNVSDSSVMAFARDWKKVCPPLLYGHAHSLYLLALYVRKLGISDIRPKGILSTSMMLVPHERRLIEDVFGVKVTDRYGCEEVSLIASECEMHDGMHLNIEHLFVEFIKEDGKQAGSGEQGKIVVTDLMNMAMPLIRYQVEDVGIPTDRKCLCGRGLPLMEHVTGRVADFLIKKDGSQVAGVSLIENTLTKIPGINQMQIVQESFDKFIIRIVPGTEYKNASDQDLNDYFKGLFGVSTAIEIQKSDSIKPELSGKYRFSICNI